MVIRSGTKRKQRGKNFVTPSGPYYLEHIMPEGAVLISLPKHIKRENFMSLSHKYDQGLISNVTTKYLLASAV